MTIATRPTTRRQIRAEALMHCPRCGHKGAIRYRFGENGLHTFQCEAYDYAPARHNECRFAFAVSDEQTGRFL